MKPGHIILEKKKEKFWGKRGRKRAPTGKKTKTWAGRNLLQNMRGQKKGDSCTAALGPEKRSGTKNVQQSGAFWNM